MNNTENLSWSDRTEQLIAEAETTGIARAASGEVRVNGLPFSRFLKQRVQPFNETEQQKGLHAMLRTYFNLAMQELATHSGKSFHSTSALNHKPEVQDFFRRFAYLEYAYRDFMPELDAKDVYLFCWLCEDVQEIARSFARIRDKQ